MKKFEDITEEERAMAIQPSKDAREKQMKKLERSKNLEKLLVECYSLSKVLLGSVQKLTDFQKKFEEVIEILDNPKDTKLYYQEETSKAASVTTIDSSDPMFKEEINKEAEQIDDPMLLEVGE